MREMTSLFWVREAVEAVELVVEGEVDRSGKDLAADQVRVQAKVKHLLAETLLAWQGSEAVTAQAGVVFLTAGSPLPEDLAGVVAMAVAKDISRPVA